MPRRSRQPSPRELAPGCLTVRLGKGTVEGMSVSPYWLFGLIGFLLLGGAELRADDDRQRVWQEARTFKQDCATATSEELPSLIERFGRMEDSYTKGSTFIALAEAWFRLQPLPVKAVFSSEETPLPPLPEGFQDELIAALRRYQEVNAPFEKLSASALKGEAKIDFQAHEADYWKLLTEMLTGQGGPFTERVLAFRWGHWCGTGSERFYAPQSRAILMALLQDQRWAEAVGASLGTRAEGPMRGTARVLSSLVSDPVAVVAGGLAFQSLPPHDYYKHQGMTGLLGLMAMLSGDERVRLLTVLASWVSPDSRRDYYRVLVKFVPIVEDPNTDGSAEGWGIEYGSGGDNLEELMAERVDEKGQALALDFLCSQATASLPVEAAQELVRVFRPKRHPAIRSALRRLLEHPSATVATEAATALAERGEKVEIPAKLGPVRYQLTINGQPYANRKVSWTVQKKEGSPGSEVTTSTEGVAELSRDYFLDGTVEGVALRSVEMANLSQPWFRILLPAPPPTNDLHPANVETMRQVLLLDLPRPDAEWMGQTMEIVLWGAQDGENQRLGFWMPVKFSLPAAREIVLPQIQRGTYRMEIRIPGFTTWNDAFEVGASEKVTLPFQRARDVRFTVQPPSGLGEFFIIPELWKNGKRVSTDWDYEKRVFRGVSVGAYTLHLPSSAEIRKTHRLGLPYDAPEFAGADIPFEVTPDNLEPLDLGVIPLGKIDP